MLIGNRHGLRYSDVTSQELYLSRRKFLNRGAAALGTLAIPLTACGEKLTRVSQSGSLHNLTGEQPSPLSAITTYNNFYEFGTGHEYPAQNARNWRPEPEWPIRLDGEVIRPKTLSLDGIMNLAPLEEYIYRHRCVERWSLVVPWIGFPLSTLLKQVEWTGNAKFVAFESFYDPGQMLSSRRAGIQFPYVEGLRLDEAMHPLTLLAVGLYGETLPNQNGAPVRLVVPWKYGFKSIKSITRIRFMEKQPPTTWNRSAANEYGFYSNVNPNRDHPRWSQKVEQRLGGGFLGQGTRMATELFNGYGAQVAGLYSGMDLLKYY
jgi:methionine sulfoxide reductase catalytic subunit